MISDQDDTHETPASDESDMSTASSPPRRNGPRVALAGLLAAEAISVLGSRMSFLAIPWLVLVTTNDPVKVGLVAGAEMLPYVLSGLFAAPLQDRFGRRRASIVADAASALVVALIALAGRIDFSVLLVLVAFAGAVRAVGDRSKNNLLKPLMDAAGANYARITSAYEGIMRTANLIGASIAGIAIATLGAVGALWFDAASFAVCALLVAMVVPDAEAAEAAKAAANGTPPPPPEPYFAAMRSGFTYFRRDRLFRSMTGLLFVTNMCSQAFGVVFIPLWVLQVLHSPMALGSVAGAHALGVVAGNIVFTAFAPHLPRYAAAVIGFIIGGPPRFIVLALSDDLALILTVTFIAGVASSSVNPTIGALIYQRIPSEMLARVGGIMAAISFGGLPLGGIIGGLAVGMLGFTDGVLAVGMISLAATLTPLVRHHLWRELDTANTKPPAPADLPVLPWSYALVRGQTGVRATLTYHDGRWDLRARRGLRPLARSHSVDAKAAIYGLSQINVDAVREAVHDVLRSDEVAVRRKTLVLRGQMATVESQLNDLSHALARADHHHTGARGSSL